MAHEDSRELRAQAVLDLAEVEIVAAGDQLSERLEDSFGARTKCAEVLDGEGREIVATGGGEGAVLANLRLLRSAGSVSAT